MGSKRTRNTTKPRRHARWGDDALTATAVDVGGLREAWDGRINALDVYEPDGIGLIGSLWAAQFQDDVGGFVASAAAVKARLDTVSKWRERIRMAYEDHGIPPQEWIDGWRSRGGNGLTLEFGRYEEGTTLADLRRHLGFS